MQTVSRLSNGQIILGKIDFQSQMTGPLVESILRSRHCDLPSLKESIEIHAIFIESLLNTGINQTIVKIYLFL